MNIKITKFLREIDTHRATCGRELKLVQNHAFSPQTVSMAMHCATCNAMIREVFTAEELGGDEGERVRAVLNRRATI